MSNRTDGLIMNSFYLIKLSSDEETFHKIGISSATNKVELKSRRISYIEEATNYKVEILRFIDCCGHPQLQTFESTILKLLSEHRYTPNIGFDGQSECFKEHPIELLVNNILAIYKAHVQKISLAVKGINSKEPDHDVSSILSFRFELSDFLSLFQNYNDLIQVFHLETDGLKTVPLENFRAKIKREVLITIRNIESSILRDLAEKEKKLSEERKKLTKLKNKQFTYGDSYGKILDERGFKKGYLNQKISEEQRIEKIEETTNLILIMNEAFDIEKSNLEKLKQDKQELIAKLSPDSALTDLN